MKKDILTRFMLRFSLMCEGTIAVAFGLLAPVLIGSVGVAMDLSQAYLVRQRLHGALDAAALSAAAIVDEDDSEVEARVKDFLRINYPPEKIGFIRMDQVSVDVSESEVTVVAYAHFPTTFMSILGVKEISVSSASVIAREIKGLEVVLVLDNTGSLDPNGDDAPGVTTNISTVRMAARNFVNILFDRVAEPDDIKIGVVPYSSSVNVGLYGLGRTPDGTNNGTPGYGTAFVNLPPGVTYNTSHSTTAQTGASWNGCVTEHMSSFYGTDASGNSVAVTHVPNTRGQMWSTETGSNAGKCLSSPSTTRCRGHGWNPFVTNNNPYPNDTQDNYTGPWDIYSYGKIIVAGNNSSSSRTCGSGYTCSNCYPSNYSTSNLRNTCREAYCFCSYTRPNEYCPYAGVMPMTSDREALLDLLRDDDPDTVQFDPQIRAHGATYSNVGMAWGMRVLSPEEPFIEGSDWEDEEWNKAIVLMTDGEMSPGGVSSAYWMNDKSTGSNNITTLNSRLSEICTWLKAEPRNVIIYTVTFDHATSDISSATKAIYRNCATSPDHYFDAPSQQKLISAFERISGALANLHVRK